MITMVLGGLWHGASWNFVIWGALHGGALAVTRMWQRARRARRVREQALAAEAAGAPDAAEAWGAPGAAEASGAPDAAEAWGAPGAAGAFGAPVPAGAPTISRPWTRWVATIATFHFVCFAWIFFRAPSFDEAALALRQLVGGRWTIEHIGPDVSLVVAAAALLHVSPVAWKDRLRDAFVRTPAVVQGLVLAAAAVALHLVAGAKPAPFVYGQF